MSVTFHQFSWRVGYVSYLSSIFMAGGLCQLPFINFHGVWVMSVAHILHCDAVFEIGV